jgi:hypothetical protein
MNYLKLKFIIFDWAIVSGMRERLGTGDLKFPSMTGGPVATSENGEGVVQVNYL